MWLYVWVSLLALLQNAGAQEECNFPAYLLRHDLWQTDITMQGAKTGKYVELTETTMVMTSFSSTQDIKVTHECVRNEEGGKVVTRTGDDAMAGYQCFQFIKRSNNVVQLMMSYVSLSLTDDICSEDNLIRQASPLVAPYVEEDEEFAQCSLNGGYDMDVYDSKGEAWCVNDQLKARWESNCQAGEGVKVEFRNFDCKATLSMQIIQTLFCLATWTEAGYVFSVVINNDDDRPGLWMMRHEVGAEDEGLQRSIIGENPDVYHSFNTLFFSDLAADIDNTPSREDYLRFRMTRVVYPTLCEDEACSCTTCDENTQFYCQKKCHRCDHLKLIRRCQFAGETRGEWLQVREGGRTNVRVGQTMMYVDGLLPLQCMQLFTEGWYEGMGRRSLSTIYSDGCRPRYNCVEMTAVSPNVMNYRLGQAVIWPSTEELTPQDICQESVFNDDPHPIEDKYHNKRSKFLIKSAGSRVPVSCGLYGNWDVNATSRVSGEVYSANINACSNDTTTFTISLKTDIGTMRQRLMCLSSTTTSTEVDMFVQVQDMDDPSEIFCYMFHQADWHIRPTLLVTHPSDCYPGLATQVLYAKSPHYLIRMDFVDEFPDGLNDTSCDREPISSTSQAMRETTLPWDRSSVSVHEHMGASSTPTYKQPSTPKHEHHYTITTTSGPSDAGDVWNNTETTTRFKDKVESTTMSGRPTSKIAGIQENGQENGDPPYTTQHSAVRAGDAAMTMPSANLLALCAILVSIRCIY